LHRKNWRIKLLNQRNTGSCRTDQGSKKVKLISLNSEQEAQECDATEV